MVPNKRDLIKEVATNDTDYNDGKWHPWNGGECPVHEDSVIDALYDDGYKIYEVPVGASPFVRWVGNLYGPKIIAFRVIKPEKEPREIVKDGVTYREVT